MNQKIDLNCQLVNEDSSLPIYSTEGAAGADVYADIESDITLNSGESMLIPTGVKCEIPEGFEIQIRPRSGLAFKHQITVLNTPATIDSDYRGELKVILINHGKQAFTVTPKMRIAQIVLAKVWQANFKIEQEFAEATQRGESGFGHTGTH